jgi:hypothetical protein
MVRTAQVVGPDPARATPANNPMQTTPATDPIQTTPATGAATAADHDPTEPTS